MLRRLLAVLAVTVNVLRGSPVTGRFQIAFSCKDLRVGEVGARLQNLVVTSGLWLRTEEPTTLHVLSGQECHLPGNTTFRVSSSEKGKVVADEQGNITCTFARVADFRLVNSEVKVSCEKDKVSAEREMLSITEASQGLPASIPVHPEPRGLDFSSSENTTERLVTSLDTERTSTEAENTHTHEELHITTNRTVEANATGAGEATDTSETTDTSTGANATDGEPHTTTDRTLVRAETTETKVTETEETTDTAAGANSTGSSLPATIGNSTEPHRLNNQLKSPSQNSQYRDRSPDQITYLIGAGAGIAVLLACIAAIVCVVRRRTPKKAAEDFFMGVSLSGSDQRYGDGSYHNAQVMTYSGLEPEVAESFSIEDIILKSQSSSSEYERPKCLREA